MDGRALREGLQALGQALRPDELAQLVRQLGGGRALGRAELAAGLLDWPALQASPDPLYASPCSGCLGTDIACESLAAQKALKTLKTLNPRISGSSTSCAAGPAWPHVCTSARGQVPCSIAHLA